jgi:hypothetical protein
VPFDVAEIRRRLGDAAAARGLPAPPEDLVRWKGWIEKGAGAWPDALPGASRPVTAELEPLASDPLAHLAARR